MGYFDELLANLAPQAQAEISNDPVPNIVHRQDATASSVPMFERILANRILDQPMAEVTVPASTEAPRGLSAYSEFVAQTRQEEVCDHFSAPSVDTYAYFVYID